MAVKTPDFNIDTIRHSLAHVLAASVLKMFPKAKFGIGPVIEGGFYYDFILPRDLEEKDLRLLGKKMRDEIRKDLAFERSEMDMKDAEKLFQDQPLKIKILEDLKKQKEKKVGIYKTGDFTDLCRGPHVNSTKDLRNAAFQLIDITKNDNIQRIYGAAFSDKKELDNFLKLTKGKGFKKEAKKEDKNKYIILDQKGNEFPAESYQYKKGEDDFKAMVFKEALKKELRGEDKEPEFIKYSRKLGFEWEAMSAPGHMRFGPKAALIMDLVSEYSEAIAKSIGIPVYTVEGTNIFNLKEKAVKEHADLYGDRLYRMNVEDNEYVMRYAACHQQFAMVRDWQISYKNLPFGAFEIADSYRFEQRGELLPLYRTRQFHMPDLHVFARDIEESKKWFFEIHKRIFREMDKVGQNYELLINLTSREFYEENKEWILELLRFKDKPALLSFYPPGKNYYWLLNIEYNIIDKLLRTREIGTVQIDVGNAERFGIKYIDGKGKEKHPIILHTAIIGSVTRYLYAVLDKALKEKVVELPLWLSPVQVRLIPVSEQFIKLSEKVAGDFEKNPIRVDIDDRSKTVGHKIRDAELDLVPYIIVLGEKEKSGKEFIVRIRKDGSQKKMSLEQLAKIIKKEIEDKPFKRLPYDRLLSKNPVF